MQLDPQVEALMAATQTCADAHRIRTFTQTVDSHSILMRIRLKDAPLGLMLLLLGLYLMFAPGWAPKLTTFRYDNARCLQLGLLLAMACCLALPPVAKLVLEAWAALKWQSRTLIATMLFGGAVSAALSGAPKIGALEVGLMTLLVFLTVGVFAIVRAIGARAEQVLAFTLVCGVGFVTLQFWVMQLLYLSEGKRFSWVSPFLEFANVRFFSQYQAYTLLLVTAIVPLLRLSGALRILVYVLAANFWALQWMVGGRALWAGVAVALLSVLVFARRGGLKWLREQVLLIVTGGLILLLFSIVTSPLQGATAIPQKLSVLDRGTQSISERIVMARAVVELTYANPVTGVGPGQFGLHYSATPGAHPHNVVLQLLSEYGLIAGLAGVAALAMLAIFALQTLWRGSLSGFDPVNTALGAALVMGLIDALFSGNLIMPHSQIALCVIGGWLLGRNVSSFHEVTCAPTVLRFEKVTVLCAIVLSALLVAMLSADYLSVLREMPRWLPERYPHFWQYGRFSDW
jgi:O-antigen ligase